MHEKSLHQFNDFSVQEGLKLCFCLLSDMNEICRKNKIDFLVVFIPSKVAVYSEHIITNPEIEHFHEFQQYIANEKRINSLLTKYCRQHHIRYLDSLPFLQNKVSLEQVFPCDANTHPSSIGYRIIAGCIAQLINKDRMETD